MKKLFLLGLIVMSMLTITSCGTKVEAGYVGVKVHLLGGSKGVDNEVVGVGRYWLGVNTDLYCFPTYQVNYSYTKSSIEGSEANEEFAFQTAEGMECAVDLGVSMHFESKSIARMFQTYRKGVDEIRATVVRNTIRDALNKVAAGMPVESVYGAGKSKLIDTVKYIVKRNLENNGIIIDNVYLIGSVRIPSNVQVALNSKVEATQLAQKAENEKRTAEANSAIKVAKAKGDAEAMVTIAKAESESNRLKQSTLSALLIQQQWIEKWDGKLPMYQTGSQSGLMFNMNK